MNGDTAPERPVYWGEALPQTAGVMAAIAEELDVPEAAVRAVVKVEAASRGFYPDGRLVMLPEAHIVLRYSSGETLARLKAAKVAGAYGTIRYPYNITARYERFEKVAEIGGLELACLSCSWGLPQGMGFNHTAFGYDTAVDMVRSFAESEDNQLVAMGRFILANPTMHRALRRLDWAGFAKAYNGRSYRQNRYDERLAEAFREFSRRALYVKGLVRRPDKGEDVKAVQRALNAAGFPMSVDGDFGKITEQAVKDFQRSQTLGADGIVGRQTAAALGIQFGD